ncbi:PLAT domain-containing protein [Salinibacterium sp. NYA9b]
MTPEPSEPSVNRRVAVVPVVVGVALLVVFAVVLTVVVTLAAASTNEEPAIPVAASSSSAPSLAPRAPEPESTVVAPASESSGNECVDFTREVASLDIESVLVAQSDREEVAIEFSLTAPVDQNSSQLGIYAETADGERAYQFLVELDDGEIDEVSAYELYRDDSDSLDTDDAEVDGSTVRFLIPRSIGKKLGDDWSWFAFSAAGESTIDTCPGTPDAPEYLIFGR